MPSNNGPLDGIRVMEWALDSPGSYCGKLLADFGAEVIKIEEPEGDPIRRLGPFQGDGPDPERSAYFLFLNTNKLGITLDLRNATDRLLLDGILRDTDIFVTDCPLAKLRERNLEFRELTKINAQLIFTPITPFGLTGPYKDYKITDLIAFQMSGYGHASPGNVDDPDVERPLRGGGRQADFAAGTIAAVASLHALFMRDQTGRGQQVDVSRQQALAAYNVGLTSYSFTGQVQSRRRGGGSMLFLYPCADGWVCMVSLQEAQWRTFLEILGGPEWGLREEFQDREARTKNRELLEPLVFEATRKFTKEQLAQTCLARRVPCQPVNSVSDVVNSRQLAAREFFIRVQHPVMGEVTVPRNPLLFSASPLSIRRPAPLQGQHTAQVLKEKLGLSEQEVTKHRQNSGQSLSLKPNRTHAVQAAKNGQTKPALDGVRVADFSWVLAGPLCTRYLASLGAEVIKIVSQVRPDSLWSGPNNLYYSKKSISLNLSTPEGLDIARQVIAVSDILIENFGTGAMDRLGLTYENLKKINPGLIYVSSSGFGRTGPARTYVAYGMTIQAYSGLTHLTGYPGGPPRGVNAALSDPITGTTALLGILAALHHRRTTGEGQYIDLSMVEATVAHLAEPVLEYLVAGKSLASVGNDDPAMAPHGVYRCKDDDTWIAVAVGNDEEWEGLCRAMGNPSWSADPRFVHASGRHEHRQELDQLVDAWTKHGDRFELMHLLQRNGVPAGPMYNSRDAVEDPHLNERGLFVELDDPIVGRKKFIGVPWRLSPDNELNYRPAPAPGQDTEYIYKEVLGISDVNYQRLVEQKVAY